MDRDSRAPYRAGMIPSNGRLVLPVLLLAGAFAAVSSAAGTPRIDMQDYYAPTTVGWTTSWEYDGGATETAAVQAAAEDDFGRTVTTRTDASDGSWLETDLVYRGGGTHYGTITSVVEGNSGVILPARAGNRVRLQPRYQAVGRTYRSRVIRGRIIDYASGEPIGRFVRRETCTLGGIEDKATPAGSYTGTLRQDWTADTRYFFSDRSRLRINRAGTWWWVAGQGVVAERTRSLVYHNRVLDSDSGPVEGWRLSASAPARGLFDLAVYRPAP